MADVQRMGEKSSNFWTQTTYVSMNIISIAIVVMAIVFFAAKKDNGHVPSDDIVKTQMLKEAILEKFPGYFRTPEQHRTIVEQLNIKRQAGIGDKKQEIPLIPATSVYHGCCITKTNYIMPKFIKDINGVEHELAQFNGYNQYFRTEECKQVSNCNTCKCHVEKGYYTAVYLIKIGVHTAYDIGLFEFDCCCKCYNLGTP